MKPEKELQLALNSFFYDITGRQPNSSDEIAVKRLRLALSTLTEVNHAAQIQVIMELFETEQKTLVITDKDRKKREQAIKEWLRKLEEIQNRLYYEIRSAYNDISEVTTQPLNSGS